MANTTDTYWEVNGQSLQTFARNITTIGGTDTPPPLRGEDELIPGGVGERWVPKVAGSRVIPFSGWVRGTDANGTPGVSRKQALEENWRALRNLLYQPGKQLSLKKRFYVGGVMRTATALAQFSGGLERTQIGQSAARFDVDLKLADPYFYDDVPTIVNPLVAGNQNVTMLGDVDTRKIKVTIAGSRTNPRILNSTVGVQFSYIDTVAGGGIVNIEVDKFLAETTPNGLPLFRSTGKITHAGAREWLLMRPGVNQINLSSTSGTGAVTLEARAAWI